MPKKVRAAIIGATGFGGEKLIEILRKHPAVEITSIACRLESPKPIEAVYPKFAKLVKLDLEPINQEKISAAADIVFLSLPHTVSFNYVPFFLRKNKIVIDLSADYRLKDYREYNEYYGVKHADVKNIAGAVYGLCEIYGDKIKAARLIANPGCYPTVSALSVAPLLKAGIVDNIIIDAKSGITGAGRKASVDLNYTAINANLYAYKIFKHQHVPEISQTFKNIAGKKINFIFTPHVVPLEQGIYATVYADLKKALSNKEILGLYRDFYKSASFVRVMPEGMPKLKDTFNTNFCDIGLQAQGKKIIIAAAIDNLIKGAAGQAVQNMNIMLGLPETTGLL